MAWVVRAGEAKAFDLVTGYGPHRVVVGLYGFSVQYHVGKTVEELAQAGQFPNALISYQDEAVLAQTLQLLGYSFRLVPSPGKGYHHTFVVIYDQAARCNRLCRWWSRKRWKPLFCACPILIGCRAVRGDSHEAHTRRFQHLE